jgi:hypothetical protein
MVKRADGTPMSDFVKVTDLQTTDLIPIVRSQTNNAILVSDFESGLGLNGSVKRALIYMQGNATNTVITTSDVPVLIAGTWSSEAASGFTTTAAGRITYTGQSKVFKIDAHACLQSASGSPDASIKIAKNGTAIAGSKIGNRLSNNHPANLATCWEFPMVAGDYVELFVENNTNTTDITVTSAIIRVS